MKSYFEIKMLGRNLSTHPSDKALATVLKKELDGEELDQAPATPEGFEVNLLDKKNTTKTKMKSKSE